MKSILVLITVILSFFFDKGEKRNPIFAQFLANNTELIAVDKDGTIVKLSVPDMKETGRFVGETGEKITLKDAVVSSDGKNLFGMYSNKKLWIWDISTGQMVKTLEGVDLIRSFKDHNFIAIHFKEGYETRLYRGGSDFSQAIITERPGMWDIEIAITCDDKFCVVGLPQNYLNIYDLEHGTLNSKFQYYPKNKSTAEPLLYMRSMKFKPSSYMLNIDWTYTNFYIDSIKPDSLGLPHDAASLKECKPEDELRFTQQHVCYFEGGSTPPISIEDFTGSVWRLTYTKETPLRIADCSLSPDKKWLIIAQKGGTLDLFNAADLDTKTSKFLGQEETIRKPKFVVSVPMPSK